MSMGDWFMLFLCLRFAPAARSMLMISTLPSEAALCSASQTA
jgi:hypothetical protein